MAMKDKANLQGLLSKKQKRFDLGCDVDKEEIFNYPYLTDEDTILFLKKHGRIMFIIRGPNSTLKSYLSEMIMTQYPTSQLCCADHYFSKTFSPPSRSQETLKQSHEYCQKKVEEACKKNESPVIVQNTHMRKSELQKYLDFAAIYNYTVIMAITLYKFNVTAEALERINPDGLNVQYFRNRLRQWEDILPLFTAWFLSPSDDEVILKSLQKTLSTLLDDGKFCRVFDCYDSDAVWDYFACRRNLYCVAGFSNKPYTMKDYYLSDIVQECYGKSYSIIISGYIISQSSVRGIVHINEEMTYLETKNQYNFEESIWEQFSSLELNNNIAEYKAVVPFCPNDATTQEKSIELEDWVEGEKIDVKNCRLIHIAQKRIEPDPFNINTKIHFSKDSLLKRLNVLNDEANFIEFEDMYVCRLPENEWLVKLAKKMKVKTLFTGLYV